MQLMMEQILKPKNWINMLELMNMQFQDGLGSINKSLNKICFLFSDLLLTLPKFKKIFKFLEIEHWHFSKLKKATSLQLTIMGF